MTGLTHSKEGLRIMEFRKSLGYTQSEMAKTLGCSQPNLNKIEKGAIGLSSQLRQVLFDKFPQISSSWLDKGMGKMTHEVLNSPEIIEGKDAKSVNNADRFEIHLRRFEELLVDGKIPFEAIVQTFKDMRKIISIQNSKIKDLEEDKLFLKKIISTAKESPFTNG